MKHDLEYDLCSGCGERAPKGLFESINHSCPINTFTYRHGSFKIRHLRQIMKGENDMTPFDGLLNFPHFKAMPHFETASELDKIFYSICRESDIESMKRLRAYLELEEIFATKY